MSSISAANIFCTAKDVV